MNMVLSTLSLAIIFTISSMLKKSTNKIGEGRDRLAGTLRPSPLTTPLVRQPGVESLTKRVSSSGLGAEEAS